MRVEDFDYTLPENRIAQNPIEPRDAAQLLLVTDNPIHRSYLPGSC